MREHHRGAGRADPRQALISPQAGRPLRNATGATTDGMAHDQVGAQTREDQPPRDSPTSLRRQGGRLIWSADRAFLWAYYRINSSAAW